MTKRSTDEHLQYSAAQTETSQELSEINPPCAPFPPAPCFIPNNVPVNGYHVAIPPREAYVWQRLGGSAAVRHLIAPVGLCAQCDEAPAINNSRNGWFCVACQTTLERFGHLPPKIE